MKVEQNEKSSSRKCDHHMNIKCVTKDRVEAGEVSVKHCSAAEMIADCFVKPLQGALFCKLEAQVLILLEDMPDCEIGLS